MSSEQKDPSTHKASCHENKWRSYRRFRRPHIYRDKRRFLWLRFVGFFLFLAVPLIIVSGGMGLLYRSGAFYPRMYEHSPWRALLCFVPIFVVGLLVYIGSRAFRQMGTPLADVMAAADTVADGDLSVRVQEKGPSEIRKLSESFNRMVDELSRADQQRRNMTADVAHELRTPIHILQGNLEGLLDGVYEANPEQIEMMLEETRLLARLVDDLQTISLAEAGQLPLYFEEVNIAELLSDVQTSFSGQAEEAGVDLTIDVDDTDLTVDADAGRLDQVLGNLVSNALRYAPAESCIRLEAESSPKHVRLRIRDEGQGIPPEDIPFIFDRFYRVEKSRTREEGGSGLGLAIAKQLIQLHQGKISAESEEGKGTTFIIDLPR